MLPAAMPYVLHSKKNRESKLSHSKTTFSTSPKGLPELASPRDKTEIKKQ
jgi:hypothetical protein